MTSPNDRIDSEMMSRFERERQYEAHRTNEERELGRLNGSGASIETVSTFTPSVKYLLKGYVDSLQAGGIKPEPIVRSRTAYNPKTKATYTSDHSVQAHRQREVRDHPYLSLFTKRTRLEISEERMEGWLLEVDYESIYAGSIYYYAILTPGYIIASGPEKFVGLGKYRSANAGIDNSPLGLTSKRDLRSAYLSEDRISNNIHARLSRLGLSWRPENH